MIQLLSTDPVSGSAPADGVGGVGVTTVTTDGSDTTGSPDGGVPVAVAVFESFFPELTSAAVTVYVAVHVTDAPGTSEAAPAGQLTAES